MKIRFASLVALVFSFFCVWWAPMLRMILSKLVFNISGQIIRGRMDIKLQVSY